MDIEIGPAIVYATDSIFRRNLGCSLKHWSNSIGVVGLGSIGKGVLNTLIKDNRYPMVFDTDMSVMAELATRHNRVVAQDTILQNSDVLFLNTGSCFLSNSPELLDQIKDYALLVLCTSGDVEAGLPQLLQNGDLQPLQTESNSEIAVFTTRSGKKVRVLLASDGVGQAPNMSMQDGSSSPANLMSDMEFFAMGSYLSSERHQLASATLHDSPSHLEDIIIQEWLSEFHSDCVNRKDGHCAPYRETHDYRYPAGAPPNTPLCEIARKSDKAEHEVV